MTEFGYIFLALIGLKTIVGWILSVRQQRASQTTQTQPEELMVDVSEQDIRKTQQYTAAKQKLQRISILVGSGLVLAWTLGGGLAYMDEITVSLSGIEQGSIVHGLAIFGFFALINAALSLPLSLYSTFSIESRFQFNRTTIGLYLQDLLKNAVLTAILGGIVLAVVLYMMQTLADTLWWFWVWCFFLVWNAFMIIAYPRWIAPLFNRFTPLEEGELKQKIETLMQRHGFKASEVYIMDASKRSTHGNAWFSGFGKNKRIVFFDTLLKRLHPNQIEAVLAHELGHYVLGHIPRRLVMMAIVSLLGLYLLDYLLVAPWFYAAFDLTPSRHIALLLFLLVLPTFTYFLQPLLNHLSRRHEFEADAWAKQYSTGKALIDALAKLYKDNAVTLSPDAWYSLWNDSHPPPAQRIKALKQPATA